MEPEGSDQARARGGQRTSARRGQRESDWLVVRRCLAIVRRALRGPASWRELIEAVVAQEGAEAYGVGAEPARRLRLGKDLERIRAHLGLDLYFDRELGGYVAGEAAIPLLDLPDDDLATIAWLAQTFTPDSPQHREVQGLLQRLRKALAPERREEIERRHTALALDLGRRDEDEIAPAVWDGLTRALVARRRIEFTYRSPQQDDQTPRRHVVDPYERYFDAARGHYYLRGWCHYSEGPRGVRPQHRYFDYRLGRMAELQLLPDKLPPFPPPAPQYAVAYELSARVARFGVSRQRGIEVTDVEMRPDGSALVHGHTHDPFLAVQALLHYGPNCRVLGGPEVLERMRSAVREMGEMYGEGT